ncbi:hypothetical protein [Microbaculum marinisediminis]|uniref:Uncharacterized protein n=1 Tax=Microbaculum marinisediminis TaxID=2931392 RepID=A0AAW5R359_9HYPH|nr:hypothetical protein [Microbaculum sp. A6E488]MCT8974711.1 hypothetical protein [Microbaculum sp. A6E488]
MTLVHRHRPDWSGRLMLAAIAGALFVMPAAAQDAAATRARDEAARTGVAATRPVLGEPKAGPRDAAPKDAAADTPQKPLQSQDAAAEPRAKAKAPARKDQGKKPQNQTARNQTAQKKEAQKKVAQKNVAQKVQKNAAPGKVQDVSVSGAGSGAVKDDIDSLDSRAELIGGIGLKDLQQTRQAPLFTPSRQKPKPPPPPKKVEKPAKPPAPPEPPKPPSLRLVGVVLTEEAKIALMMAQDRSVKRLALGDEIDGWAVVKLDPETVELKLKGQRSVYRMFKPQAAGADSPNEDGRGRNARKKKRKN